MSLLKKNERCARRPSIDLTNFYMEMQICLHDKFLGEISSN